MQHVAHRASDEVAQLWQAFAASRAEADALRAALTDMLSEYERYFRYWNPKWTSEAAADSPVGRARTALASAALGGDGWQTMETARKDGTRLLLWHPLWSAPDAGGFNGRFWASSHSDAPYRHQPTQWRSNVLPPVKEGVSSVASDGALRWRPGFALVADETVAEAIDLLTLGSHGSPAEAGFTEPSNRARANAAANALRCYRVYPPLLTPPVARQEGSDE